MHRSQRIVRRTLLIAGITLATAVPLLDSGHVSASPSPPGSAVTGGSATVTTVPTPYTVRSGDSLAGIAARYAVGFSALLRTNSMTVASVIHPGDTLTLPAGARTTPLVTARAATSRTATSATSATNVAAVPAPADASATSYVVKPGDALAGIAWKHGVKLGALVKANGLTTASVIFPGQILTIPPATMPIPTPAAPSTTAPSTTAPSTTAPSTSNAAVPTSTTPAANASIETVLTFLRSQVGVPYKFFSAGPDAYDCSGLVVAGWKQIGVNLPHQSQALSSRGTAVDWLTSPIQPGDLVFTSVYGDVARITHVGIALSDSTWIQAVGAGRTVTIGSLPSDTKILAVRRLA